jgi:hypothetical protein
MSKYLIILVGCLFILIIAGILIWQLWSGGETPSPTLSPTLTPPIDETANWQTYTNQEFGYEVKYPDFYYMEFTHIYDENSGETTPTNGAYFRNEEFKENPAAGCCFNVYIKPNLLNKNLEDWFADDSTEAEFGSDEHTESGKFYYNLKEAQLEKTIVDGQEALKFYQIGGYPSDAMYLLVKKDTYIVEISYFLCAQELNTFEQILSNFKFIDINGED